MPFTIWVLFLWLRPTVPLVMTTLYSPKSLLRSRNTAKNTSNGLTNMRSRLYTLCKLSRQLYLEVKASVTCGVTNISSTQNTLYLIISLTRKSVWKPFFFIFYFFCFLQFYHLYNRLNSSSCFFSSDIPVMILSSVN